jgi:site-specific DNA-methyltransferase (adenine-specific)
MNTLYYGDNLEILRSGKIKPESVDLCYIDPPFNSKRNYNQIYNNMGKEDRAQAQAFIDTWIWDDRAAQGFEEIIGNVEGRFQPQTVELIKGLRNVLNEGSLLAYLVSITLRVVELHRALKDTGTFFLHCDPTASHYLKLVLDGIFCANRLGDFKNEIIWRRTGSHNARRSFGPIHDVIFFYAKTNEHYFRIVKRPYMLGHVKSRYTYDETVGKYKFTSGGNVLTGSGATDGDSGRPWRGFDPSAKHRHWAIPGFLAEQMGEDFQELSVLEKLDALYDAGLIDIDEESAWPTPVRYLKADSGSPIQDIWAFQPYTEKTVYGTDKGIDTDVMWLGPTDPERLGYQTQKPLGLLERIIRSACPPGGTVLDAYCGCGTTLDVAQKLNLPWIGIDITYQSISLVLRRLERRYSISCIKNIKQDGIPKDMASAYALAHKKDDRLRKEFEKWAVLTYTNNRAIINEKKGADAGIDARAYFMTGKKDNAKIIFQVKSGGVKRGDIATLHGDMEREQAALAVLITLEEPSRPMLSEAKAAGQYRHENMGRSYDRISIVTVKKIVEGGKRLEIPMSLEVIKAAQRGIDAEQIDLIE